MMKTGALAAMLAAGFSAAAATTLNLACDKKDAVCKVGEEVAFTLTAMDETGALVRNGRFSASVDNFGPRELVARREYDLAAANPVVIRGRLDEPGFMRVKVAMPGVTNFLWSVAVNPERIRPGAACPADFDEFWDREIAKYDAEVKEDVELTPLPQLDCNGLKLFKVSLSAPHGRKIHGILSRPADLTKGPYPLRFEGKGAGPASQGFTGRPGRVTLCMNVHFYDPPVPSSKKENDKLQEVENREWFSRFKAKRAGYQVLGIAGERQDYFYHDVILATRRAFRWAAREPYVDAADITYNSTSQGGGFGLYMAALCPQIRKLAVFVPALTDLCGYQAGRMSGWPRLIEEQLDENREKAAANAGYYDAVNFAARVRCPTRVTVGFSDDTCPPTAVYSAYNSLKVQDREIWHGIGMTHLVRRDIYEKGDRWLAEKAEMKTPETSRLFERREDPLTGVVSYRLKSGLADFHQQSLYFTAKSMTEDGRFIVFDTTPDPFAEPKVRRNTETRRKYVVDFLRDEVYPVGGASVDGQIPFLDVKTDKLYYVGRDHMSVCVCDLRDDPSRETVLCRFSKDILEGEKAVRRMATHLTLTPDRRHAFIDYSVDTVDPERGVSAFGRGTRWFLGMADLRTGEMKKWTETEFCSNHASINPKDASLGLFAYEGCWNKTVTGADGKKRSVRRGENEVFPRMWLAHADGRIEMMPSRIWNFATHENWAEDGRGFYWSAFHGGTAYHDLATGEQTRVCPYWAIHTDMSPDGNYVVTDQWADNDGFRGCAWRYAFWNRATGRGIAICSYSPAIATKDRQSSLHPDAHVQFVCGGRYIIATANDDQRRMTVAVTPVEPLAKLTADPATAPRLRRLPVEWKDVNTADELCEIVADCEAFRREGLVTPPPVRCDVAWVPYGVFAVVNGERRRLAVEPYLGEKPMETVVRFKVPKGTTALDFAINAPGRFEPKDRDTLAKRPPARRLELGKERAPSAWNADWPKGTAPVAVSRRLSELFPTTEPDDYHPEHS